MRRERSVQGPGEPQGGRRAWPSRSAGCSVRVSLPGRQRGGVRKDFRINKDLKDSRPNAFSRGGHTKIVQVEFKEAGDGRGREALGGLGAEGRNSSGGAPGLD